LHKYDIIFFVVGNEDVYLDMVLTYFKACFLIFVAASIFPKWNE